MVKELTETLKAIHAQTSNDVAPVLTRIESYYTDFINNFDLNPEPIWTPASVYRKQRRDVSKRLMMAAAGIHDVRDKRILEVGCGQGDNIAEYLMWGAPVDAISGIDYMGDYIPMLNRRFPGLDARQASVHELPYDDNTFDLIGQSTVFSSLQDLDLMKKGAKELCRVLTPGGAILWYDFRYKSPSNDNVAAVTAAMIKDFFPNTKIYMRTSTLVPQLARKIAPISFAACIALESFPFLRGHIAAVIKPN